MSIAPLAKRPMLWQRRASVDGCSDSDRGIEPENGRVAQW